MGNNVSSLRYEDPRVNSTEVSSAQGLELGASSGEIASSTRSPDIMEISSPPDEIDNSHIRKDLHFPVTMDEPKFREIMHPKSKEDLEKYLLWRYLVRDMFQPEPKIVEDTNEELKRINLSSEKKDFSSIREQRYWQNQIFLRRAVEQGLRNGYHEQNLKLWLEDLHKIACSGLDGDNHYYVCKSPREIIKSEGVMTRYQDQDPDIEKSRIEGYLEKFKQFLDIRSSSKNNTQDWLSDLAEKYINITLCPPFENVNNSIVMNILNLMLTNKGMNQISHGNLDQCIFYSKYYDEQKLKKAIGEFPSIFLRAILQTNQKLEKEFDSSLLNIPDKFAKDNKDYLEKLSELNKYGVLNPQTHHFMKYLSTGDLAEKCNIFQVIIEFIDFLKKGCEKGLFTEELLTNVSDNISQAFNNLNLNEDLFHRQKLFLIQSIGLKSRYSDFDTRVSTLEELLRNRSKEVKARNIDAGECAFQLRKEGLNFLNSTDT